MYIFIDESGTTDEKSKQKFLVIGFAIAENRDFVDKLIFEIKNQCQIKGKPIKQRELSYHDLTPFQREIAIKQIINSGYRNMYLCFFDVDKADKRFVTGKYEHRIQMNSIANVLSRLDKQEMRKKDCIKVIMDEKLVDVELSEIRKAFWNYLETKKGVSIETAKSQKDRGIQLADLIAGAFRAKLMKKSDLFEVDYTHVFQITQVDLDKFIVDGMKKV